MTLRRKRLMWGNPGEGGSPLSALLDQTGPVRRPDFIGIGSEKCGTTWLWGRLREHPEIGVPVPKELRYFATRHIGTQPIMAATTQLLTGKRRALTPIQAEAVRNELRLLNLTDESYLRIFGAYDQARVVGEVSPMYCVMPREGVEHMHRLCAGTRLILLLRDPAQRMISGGKMKAGETGLPMTEDLVWRYLDVPIQERLSRYSQIIALYREFWPPEAMFIGFIDDIKSDPKGLMDRIFAFLGVGPAPEGAINYDERNNEGVSFSVSPAFERRVHDRLRAEYEALEALFPERVAAWRERYAV